MATSLDQSEIADATVKILRDSDLQQLTLRKVMNILSEQFGYKTSEFSPWKKFVKEKIDEYLKTIPQAEPKEEEEDINASENVRGPPPPRPTKLKGLMKAVVLAQPLADLLGEVVLPRTQISKRISDYAKEHNLQNPNDGREIICDEKLKKVFDIDKFTYFSLNKHISNLVYKPSDCSEELQELAAKCEEKLLDEMATKQAEDYANGIDPAQKKTRKRKRVAQVDADGNPVKKKLNGLSKPMHLDAELAEICGSDVLSRSEVVKKIWEYIKANDLQDPENKRNIICDDKLKSLFDGKERVPGFGMSKYLSSHLSKYTGEVDETGAPV